LLWLLLLLLMQWQLLLVRHGHRRHRQVGDDQRAPPLEQPERVDLAAQPGRPARNPSRLEELPVSD
jgi:hypothetical protein